MIERTLLTPQDLRHVKDRTNFRSTIVLRALLSLVCIGLLSGCATDFQKNRAFLPDYKYNEVRELYEQTESVAIVRQILEDNRWYESDINEAIYRLRQENDSVRETP